jgi:uncharacterized protein
MHPTTRLGRGLGRDRQRRLGRSHARLQRAPAEVDAVLVEAEKAGATIARTGAETFWGGYAGVFIDPDGHPWGSHTTPGGRCDDGSIELPSD